MLLTRRLVVVLLALVGAVTLLPLPFTGDQSLFSLGGASLTAGHPLYADFWDIKQPGVYLLYGGLRAVHHGPFLVHLFDLALQVGAAVLVQRCTRTWFERPWVSAVAPVLVVGPYLLSSGAANAGLIEPMTTLPLAACLFLGWGAVTRKDARLLVAAGLLAGVVACFKLVLAPTLGVAALGPWLLRPPAGLGRLRPVGAWVAGLAAPLIVVLTYLVASGAGLGLVYRTTFVIPPQVSGLPDFHSREQTVAYLHQLRVVLAGPVVLAAVALLDRRRRAETPATFLPVVLATMVTSLLLSLPQKLNLYQVYVLAAPLGLLAAVGLDRLLDHLRWRVVGVAAAAVATVPLLHTGLDAGRALATHHLALGTADRAAYAAAVNDENDVVRTDAAAGSAAYPIPAGATFYAESDPLYYELLGQDRQALTFNGWSPEQMTDAQWAEWDREFTTVRPQVFLLDTFSRPYLLAHAPLAAAMLGTTYRVVYSPPTDDGLAATWYAGTGAPGTDAGPTRL